MSPEFANARSVSMRDGSAGFLSEPGLQLRGGSSG